MTSSRLPAIFFGHGSPMVTLDDNRFNEAWRAWGDALRRRAAPPRAIVCVSAHWYTRGTAVTAMARPKTIHDFGGFPQALFDIQYPAPGDAALAARVRDLLAPTEVFLDDSEWGLDHGTWAVLRHAFPAADVPVIQLSLDGTQPARFHYELAKRLAPLRDEGVLICASGNVVHNLRMMKRNDEAAAFDWAGRFNSAIIAALADHDHDVLIDFELLGEDARLAVPTPEHYLPLLYIAALQDEHDKMTIATDEIVNGSLSMLSAIVEPH
jgi:4,5-DOPA dioxygenase extradiol